MWPLPHIALQAAGNLSLTQKRAAVKCHHALLARMRSLLTERGKLVAMLQVGLGKELIQCAALPDCATLPDCARQL